jgi:hypothetical protein
VTRRLSSIDRGWRARGSAGGLNRGRIIERLRLRIQRDEAHLGFRERKGQHTLTDDAIASDLRVFALAIAYLEERIRDES